MGPHEAIHNAANRRPVRIGILAAASVAIAFSAWLATRPPVGVSGRGEMTRFVVSGSSMAPTLLGPSCRAKCDRCGIACVVDETARKLTSERLLCSHCGGQLRLASVPVEEVPVQQGAASAIGKGADVVRVETEDRENPRRGDLVAVRRAEDATPYVKRVVAVAGDTVALDHDGIHLTVNGRRIEDTLQGLGGTFPLPHFLVDQDDLRAASRWSPQAETSWQRDEKRRWTKSAAVRNVNAKQDSEWLLYSHRSVYHHDRPSPILDDYQYNVGLSRKLLPVDRLSVSGVSDSSGTLEVAFWSNGSIRVASIEVRAGKAFGTSIFDARAAANPSSFVPLNELRPIALRATHGSPTIRSLTVRRCVEYRLRRLDDRDRYPIAIPPGKIFVLGDNVPVSNDSRDTGLIRTTDIQGLVVARE